MDTKDKELNNLVSNLNEQVALGGNEKTKNWWENYVKHDTKFLGVGIPKIRELLKKWYEENNIPHYSISDQVLLSKLMLQGEYAEDKLAGILLLQLYLYKCAEWREIVEMLESVFESGFIYDWNICDWLCVRVLGPLVKLNGADCAKYISNWSEAKNLWQARSSVVTFANLTSEKQFKPLFLKSCKTLIKREERFAKTGVGWIMRELSKTDKESVVKFINTHKGYFTKEVMKNSTKYFKGEEISNLKGS